MWPLLKAGGGSGTGRDFAIVANLSARVGSIGDNRLGGWHSYRSSKAALNQCMISLQSSSEWISYLKGLKESSLLLNHVFPTEK